jgi:hypothetical protein
MPWYASERRPVALSGFWATGHAAADTPSPRRWRSSGVGSKTAEALLLMLLRAVHTETDEPRSRAPASPSRRSVPALSPSANLASRWRRKLMDTTAWIRSAMSRRKRSCATSCFRYCTNSRISSDSSSDHGSFGMLPSRAKRTRMISMPRCSAAAISSHP